MNIHCWRVCFHVLNQGLLHCLWIREGLQVCWEQPPGGQHSPPAEVQLQGSRCPRRGGVTRRSINYDLLCVSDVTRKHLLM